MLGVKVQSIEGKSLEQFITAMDPILSRDNSQTLSVMGTMRMRQTALMNALGLAASPDKLEITILDKNGQPKKITLPGTKSVPSRRLWDGLPDNWLSLENEIPVKPFYLKDRYRYYWFEYLPKEKTVWFANITGYLTIQPIHILSFWTNCNALHRKKFCRKTGDRC